MKKGEWACAVNESNDIITLYHNPRCAKSRAALALLREHGIEPKVVEYLRAPLTAEQLRTLIAQLGVAPRQAVRTKEAAYRESGLSASSSLEEVVAALVAYPILLERPIAVRGDRAVIGRPPEEVLRLIST